uniref:Uncharacterized protein n=1 Tax=Phlebotomus papatasi TaxID=29031 RepID=A0A1B0DIF0_PHLPP
MPMHKINISAKMVLVDLPQMREHNHLSLMVLWVALVLRLRMHSRRGSMLAQMVSQDLLDCPEDRHTIFPMVKL